MSVSSDTTSSLKLYVTRKKEIAADIYLFELRDRSGSDLPGFEAGAHVTITAPSGQKRRYSLCNNPDDRDRYVIAVKMEDAGRGGSASLIKGIGVDDDIVAEPPDNSFEMSEQEPSSYIFIAGGIGITPIRSMIQHLINMGKTNFKLFYFTRTPEVMAFRDEFKAAEFSGKVILHHDRGNPGEAYDLWPVLKEPGGAHLYCCGPRGLMDAVRDMTGHWPDSAVHFEDFAGAVVKGVVDRPFVVRLARSGKLIEVPAGVSILDTLRQHGLAVRSSCESGTCGTCRTRYISGEPEHRDLVLSERDKLTDIMICVSRAKTPEIELDI